MANFVGLKLARDYTTKDVAQHDGLRWLESNAYVSEERYCVCWINQWTPSVFRKKSAFNTNWWKARVAPTLLELQLQKDKSSRNKANTMHCRPAGTQQTLGQRLMIAEALHGGQPREDAVSCWCSLWRRALLSEEKNKRLLNDLHLAGDLGNPPIRINGFGVCWLRCL